MASDVSQGSVGSAALVPQEESQRASAELWVTRSALSLTSALPKRPDIVRRSLTEEVRQPLNGLRLLWLCPLTPYMSASLGRERSGQIAENYVEF